MDKNSTDSTFKIKKMVKEELNTQTKLFFKDSSKTT